ncbi:MAG: hypothetical protein KC635_00870 [Myxococcales bacterium]|nr:hypothetical protein [Myxococcales bacterium]MCB9737030.1 hypothetical protein [Deltaproteobacteria bacterium]
MSDEAFRNLASAGLQAVFQAFEVLTGTRFELRVLEPPIVGWDTLAAFSGPLVVFETRLMVGRRVRAGLVMPERLARSLSATVMMVDAPPEAVSTAVLGAVDEAMNVVVGAWNTALEDEALLWDDRPSARVVRHLDASAFAAGLAEQPTGLFLVSLSAGGVDLPVALMGGPPWFPEAMVARDPDAPEPPAAVAPPVGPRSVRGVPRPIGPSTTRAMRQAMGGAPTTDAGALAAAVPSLDAANDPALAAALMVVDKTGAFLQWLKLQLQNPSFAFLRGAALPADVAEHAVLLVKPRGLDDGAVTAQTTLIIERA